MFSIAFYNLENFYEPFFKGNHKSDSAYFSFQNWTKDKYLRKVKNICNVFSLIKSKIGELPLIIGICEIQGKKVIQDLLENEVFDGKYSFIHYNSLDERGMDVALVYNKNEIEILHSEPLSYVFEMGDNDKKYIDTTRDVLYCKTKKNQEIYHIFVLHLPSQRENNINQSKRLFILGNLKDKVKKLALDDEHIVVLGDFNENPTSTSILDFSKDNFGVEFLHNPFYELFLQNKFTNYHLNFGLLFDQILVSQKMFKKYKIIPHIFNHSILCNSEDSNISKPFRTFSGTRYLGGYSDHFPVFITCNP